MNPLLLPPRLLLRALDDLHTIATVAAGLEDAERRLSERLAAVVALGERIENVVVDGLELAEAIRETGERVAVLGDRLDTRMGDFDRLADAILEQGRRVEVAGREVAESGRQIADALPVMQRAITMAEPLEGAVERLGRILDRLPGGRVRPGG